MRTRVLRLVCVLLIGLVSALPAPQAHASPRFADIGIERWLNSLQHEDPEVRRNAAWMLGRYASAARGSRALTAGVSGRLQDRLRRERDHGVLRAIIYALSRYPTPDVDVSLRDAANPDSGLPPAVRATALRALLSRLEEPASLAPWLLRLSWTGGLNGPGDVAHEAAVEALAALPHNAFAAAIANAQEMSVGLVGALRAIGRRGDPRWAHPLLEALAPSRVSAGAPRVLAALDSVARLRCVEAAELVLNLALRGDDPAVRRAAVRTLASLGGAFDAAALRHLLAEPPLREVTLDTLGALGDRGALPSITPLLGAAWAGDRRAAAEALGAIGAVASIASLRERAVVERDAEVRRAMWRAIAQIGGGDARSALSIDDQSARWALSELLLREGGGDAHPMGASDPAARMVAALSGEAIEPRWSDDADARVAMALALGHARHDEVRRAESLDLALARESDEGVRVAIVLALARIGADPSSERGARGRACDALLSLVARESDAPSLAAVVAVSRLGALRVSAAREVVAHLVMSPGRDPLVRRVAIEAAGRLEIRGLRVAVERALAVDSDDSVRGAAAFALAAIAGRGARDALDEGLSVASTQALVEQIRAAHAQAVGDGEPIADSRSVARAANAPPRSVWCVTAGDGALVFGVATGDGEVWIDGAPALDEASLTRAR